MIFIEYRGQHEPKYAFISKREELEACLRWLQDVLDKMREKNRDTDSFFDFRDYKD